MGDDHTIAALFRVHVQTVSKWRRGLLDPKPDHVVWITTLNEAMGRHPPLKRMIPHNLQHYGVVAAWGVILHHVDLPSCWHRETPHHAVRDRPHW